MLMHAPVIFTLSAMARSLDGQQIARAKFELGAKGQFPTPVVQQQAFQQAAQALASNDMILLSKGQFITAITGAEKETYGGADFVPYDPAVTPAETDMHAPITIDMIIKVTDGSNMADLEVSLGRRGCFLSPAYIKSEYDRVVAEDLPTGYRPMTKREFFNELAYQASGNRALRFAAPGATEFEPLTY